MQPRWPVETAGCRCSIGAGALANTRCWPGACCPASPSSITAKKSPLDPSWATPRDAGIPDLDASIWVGLFAPKGTPQAIVDRINREVRETLKSPDVQKRFVESAGGEAIGMTQQEFLARIKSDAERYKRVVQKAGVKPG